MYKISLRGLSKELIDKNKIMSKQITSKNTENSNEFYTVLPVFKKGIADVGSKIYNNPTLEDLENEIWVDALGFDGVYEVSNLGRIKSLGRWVSNGKSERWIKEKIRKQVLVSDGRLTCPLKGVSINVSAIIFLSFNSDTPYNPKKQCVMHINKIKDDNRLCNLKIESISKSHKINYKKNLLPHLEKNNKKARNEYLKLTHKICTKCNENKTIINFEYGRNKCKSCRKIEKKESYLKRKIKPQQ